MVNAGWIRSQRNGRFRDDAARVRRAAALGRDPRAASACDVGLRRQRCASPKPSGVLPELCPVDIPDGTTRPDLSIPPAIRVGLSQEPILNGKPPQAAQTCTGRGFHNGRMGYGSGFLLGSTFCREWKNLVVFWVSAQGLFCPPSSHACSDTVEWKPGKAAIGSASRRGRGL